MRAFRLVFALAIVFAVALHALPVTAAQTVSGVIVETTQPIDADLRDTLNSWLSVSPPAPYPYWIVTYTEEVSLDTYVSMVALADWDPARDWTLEDGDAVWMGTVLVRVDGSVEMFSQPLARGVPKLAMPVMPAPGGSSSVKFPWSSGRTMMYGKRGVHGSGDYGTNGMWAVDFVGGNDLGSGVASDTVYASASGTVDYVCDDGTSVAVRLHGGDDYFLYAHLEDNANLTMAHQFSARANMGSLVHGSFDDDCGWAEQADNHYHIHWMFVPDNDDTMQVEGCILDMNTKKWTCGTTVYGIGEYIKAGGSSGGGGTGDGEDDPSTTNEDVTFFDFVLVGFVDIWQTLVIDNLPDHETFEYTSILINSIKLTLRIARVLVYGNINLGPLMTVIGLGISIKIGFGIAWIVVFLFKAWKSLVPVLGS